MSKVRCLIKYAPNIVDVSGAVVNRVDITRKATDGIGIFTVNLKNDNGEWLGQFGADDPIQIQINDIIFFEGFLDQGMPLAEAKEAAIKRMYELVGRDYGQDLQNKIVNKTGEWVYEKQYADLILDDMLAKANSYILFTPTADHKYGGADPIPQIAYTDRGDEFLQEAFRKIMEGINYDYYIDENKNLKIFPMGIYNSGIVLKNVAGASDNNILDLRKTEFDTFELRNYVVAKGDFIEDAWTEGNASDFTGETGNVITNETVLVYNNVISATSIKSAKGTATKCSLQLAFPKYNYDNLPFDLFGKEDIPVWLYADAPAAFGHVYLELEDTEGNIIRWRFGLWFGILGGEPYFTPGKWVQAVVSIGRECDVRERPWWEYTKANRWEYSTKVSTFNWKVKRIKFVADNSTVNFLLIDGLRIPLSTASYKQDSGSQTLYKVRHQPISAKNVRSQIELDDLAASELEKVKAPIQGLRVIAVGSAGIIAGVNKWIPGYCVQVNSPGDGINNAWYRMVEIHVSVAEYPLLKGHDFIAEIVLVPYQTAVSGKRLSYIESPEVALIRSITERVRILEKKEELKRDFFPAMPGPMGNKILISDFLALADTDIDWTRRWEEYKFVDRHSSTSIIDDATAANGKSLKMPSPTIAYVAFKSPFLTGQLSGDVYIIFALKVSSNTPTSIISHISLMASTEERSGFDIYPNQFPTANKWHHFAIRGRIEANDTDVYGRLIRYKLDGVDLYCDFVGIVPANVPIGYTDVTIQAGTQNTSAQDATQNTTAQDATQNTSAQSGFMGWTEIVNVIESGYNLGTDWGVILSGTAGSTADPIDWSHYEIEITVTSGTCDVFWRLKISGDYRIKDFRKSLPLDAQVKTLVLDIMLTSGQLYELSMKRVGNATVVTVSLKIRQARKHTHAMTNPSHSTGTNNPTHSTGIVNPSHPHGANNPSHEQ